MRAIRDFILFFVVVIIEIIRLIFEIDDCGIFDDFVFFLCFFCGIFTAWLCGCFFCLSGKDTFLPDLS